MAKYDGPQRKQKVTDKNGNRVTRTVGSNATSVTSNADARASFYPRPVKTVEPIVHGAFEGAKHIFRPAPEGYREVTVTSVEHMGWLGRSGVPKYRLTADNGWEFEAADHDLNSFTGASEERPVRVAYGDILRRGTDRRDITVTGEAAPVAYAKPLAASGKSPAEVAELYRQGIPLEFALNL